MLPQRAVFESETALLLVAISGLASSYIQHIRDALCSNLCGSPGRRCDSSLHLAAEVVAVATSALFTVADPGDVAFRIVSESYAPA